MGLFHSELEHQPLGCLRQPRATSTGPRVVVVSGDACNAPWSSLSRRTEGHAPGHPCGLLAGVRACSVSRASLSRTISAHVLISRFSAPSVRKLLKASVSWSSTPNLRAILATAPRGGRAPKRVCHTAALPTYGCCMNATKLPLVCSSAFDSASRKSTTDFRTADSRSAWARPLSSSGFLGMPRVRDGGLDRASPVLSRPNRFQGHERPLSNEHAAPPKSRRCPASRPSAPGAHARITRALPPCLASGLLCHTCAHVGQAAVELPWPPISADQHTSPCALVSDCARPSG